MGQVRRCSAVSSELPHLHKAGPRWKPHYAKVLFCSHDSSAKSVEASPVFPGAWCPGTKDSVGSIESLPGRVNVVGVFSKGADCIRASSMGMS